MSLFKNALAVATGGVSLVATAAISKAKQMASRPKREDRAAKRAAKAPAAVRLAQAAAIRSERMSQVAEQPMNYNAIPAVAHELSHLSGQVTKFAEDTTDYGFLPKGGFLENLKRGSIFINGQYFSANTLLASFAMLKASRLVHEPKKGSGILEALSPDVAPIKVLYGARVTTDKDTARHEDDVFAIFPEGGVFRSVNSESATSWPVGATVFMGTVPHIAPDFKTFGKTAAAMFLASREHPALKVLSMFSERLGSFVGLGQGVDFNR